MLPAMEPQTRITRSLLALIDLVLPGLGGRIWRTITVWSDRARQRRALAKLDADRLRDIGITHTQARREADKPFWKK